MLYQDGRVNMLTVTPGEKTSDPMFGPTSVFPGANSSWLPPFQDMNFSSRSRVSRSEMSGSTQSPVGVILNSRTSGVWVNVSARRRKLSVARVRMVI